MVTYSCIENKKPVSFNNILDEEVKIINFTKPWSLRGHLFSTLCDTVVPVYIVLFLHTGACWVSPGKEITGCMNAELNSHIFHGALVFTWKNSRQNIDGQIWRLSSSLYKDKQSDLIVSRKSRIVFMDNNKIWAFKRKLEFLATCIHPHYEFRVLQTFLMKSEVMLTHTVLWFSKIEWAKIWKII